MVDLLLVQVVNLQLRRIKIDTYVIPPSGSFIIQIELTKAGYYNQKITIQDLSGLIFGVRLLSRKQVLVNSISKLLDFNTENDISIINCQNNLISIAIPFSVLLENKYYLCSLYAKTQAGELILYKFQLQIDNINSSLPLIKTKKITLDEDSYMFLAIDQQVSQDSK